MKAKPLIKIDNGYADCDPKSATHIMLHLPGPMPNRILPVMIGGRREGTPNWTWNGDVDNVTVKPSVLTRGGGRAWKDGKIADQEYVNHICHSFINDGKVQFLDDCTHEFAGMTMDLLDVE